MYVNYTVPADFGSFAGGAPQAVFPGVDAGLAAKLANVDVKQQMDWTLYDTKYFVAGTALPTSQITFFSAQIGSQDVVANSTGVAFTKTEADTNITQPNQLERGQIFICRSIQAQVTEPGNFSLTVQATQNTTLELTGPTSAIATAATGGVIISNLVFNYLTRGVIKLKVGTNFFESGPLSHFPSEFGISGYASTAATGLQANAPAAVTVPNEAVANNGFGRGRYIIPRTILGGQNFGVGLVFPVSFTPSRNSQIQIILRGTLYRDVS